jgi:Kef-type K+ transport system membrane component KefB
MASDSLVFLTQLGVMLAVALLFGRAAARLRQPPLVGEILGGLLLGPTLLGAFAPSLFAWLFPHDCPTVSARETLLTLGMLFFLFVAGLEVNLASLRATGRSVVLTSGLSVVVPFALGYLAVLAWPGVWGLAPNGDVSTLALFVGTALSISALPVIARMLMDFGLMGTRLGALVMTSATVADIVGWGLFALVLGRVERGPAAIDGLGWSFGRPLVVMLGIVLIGRWLVLPLFRRLQRANGSTATFIGTTTVLILALSALTEAAGVHAVFGAFLAGVAIGTGLGPREGNRAHEVLFQFAVSIFAPLYFVSVGLKVDVGAHFDLALVALVLVLAFLGKLLGASLGGLLGGLPRREALAVGFALNARGAMEIILATVALDRGVIDERLFVALVIMAIATSLVGAPMLQRLSRPVGT